MSPITDHNSAFPPITKEFIQVFLADNYSLKAELQVLDGEEDLNFKVVTKDKNFLLKLIHPAKAKEYSVFYSDLSEFIGSIQNPPLFQYVIPTNRGKQVSRPNEFYALLLSWITGRRWSAVNPVSDKLLIDLGRSTAQLSLSLKDFDHPWLNRKLDWDLAQSLWTKKNIGLFEGSEKESLLYFIEKFEKAYPSYQKLRKGAIQNDGNDNNILVSEDRQNPQVIAIIDFGDAIHSQLINNLAITCAYAAMEKPDPLRAAAKVVEGYNTLFPLDEQELEHLYTLIGMRLVTSLCKSAVNKKENPSNTYLLISEKSAKELLEKWKKVAPQLAYYTFRKACQMDAHPRYKDFLSYAVSNLRSIKELFKTNDLSGVQHIDMSVGSKWLGPRHEFIDDELKSFRLSRLSVQAPDKIVAGGYLENRAFYSTDAYKKEGNNGPEYRSIHLGIDFWDKAGTAIYALWDGEVYSIFNNDNHKDYGPTLILKHQTDRGLSFYSLYGHLSLECLNIWKKGDQISRGQLIAYFGAWEENGHWTPHLHFQLILDMLGNTHDFPGVAFPAEVDIWKEICPDPNLFFQEKELEAKSDRSADFLIKYRRKHLGRGMSLSYKNSLHIVRGEGPHLLSIDGRKYLDMVNNVAHCGHEHPRIVQAGQKQMALLNTNTRYLHENLVEFTEELLKNLPSQLSVVHLVNSGSEANELALRMAQTYSGQEDFVAVEVGYHGNTNKTIEVSSYKFDGKGGRGCPSTTHLMPLPDSFRGLYKGIESYKYASHIHSILNDLERNGKKPAGFICESILSCGGQVELPNNYLAEIYPEIRRRGGLCIADEVQVGLGRVGSHFSAFEMQGVVPDILTLGKPIGNGHPIGVVVCTEEVADAFANGMEYFNTFGGNPVSCAIGTEVLRVVEDEGLQAHAKQVGALIKEGLYELQKEFPIIGDVRGKGLFLGFELTNEARVPLARQASYLSNRMRDLGILMSTDGPDYNVLKIKPPMVIQREHVEEFLARLNQVFKEDFMRLGS